MAISRKMLKYRRKLRKGYVMKPVTFAKIEKSAMKKYHIGKKRAAAVAGAAYWASLKHKYKTRNK